MICSHNLTLHSYLKEWDSSTKLSGIFPRYIAKYKKQLQSSAYVSVWVRVCVCKIYLGFAYVWDISRRMHMKLEKEEEIE